MQPGPTAEDFGGQTLENGAGIRFQGWKIEKSEGAIASSGAIRELKVRLQEGASTDEQLPRLPEAIFLNNKLSMVHEASGHKVTFDAEGALLQWLNNSLVNGSGGLTIPAASLGSWKEKLDKQAQHAGDTPGRRDWDWIASCIAFVALFPVAIVVFFYKLAVSVVGALLRWLRRRSKRD